MTEFNKKAICIKNYKEHATLFKVDVLDIILYQELAYRNGIRVKDLAGITWYFEKKDSGRPGFCFYEFFMPINE